MERAGGAPMADTIRCDVSDNVAQITLDDGKVNAMALAFFAGLNAALDRAEHERPGALVIAGRAGVFCARLDLNEVAIGLALPTWAIVPAQAAFPPRRHTEAILHARAYSPEEALEQHIVHEVVRPAERVVPAARAAAGPLAALDQTAYAISKARHRAMAVRWAAEQLETEIAALPSRAAIK